MGDNTSGLIAAAGATRPNGRPLFDYWFDIEGATNANETYLAAQALAAGGSAAGLGLTETAKRAINEIEEENGGTPAQQPGAYADLAVVTHSRQIAASSVKGVVIDHDVDDGEVPYNQSREEQVSLATAGVGTDFYTFVRDARDSSDHGVQLDQELLGALPTGYTSPLAGHGFEGSQTQLVIETGLALWTSSTGPGKRRAAASPGSSWSTAASEPSASVNPGASPSVQESSTAVETRVHLCSGERRVLATRATECAAAPGTRQSPTCPVLVRHRSHQSRPSVHPDGSHRRR
jgi:hypothetical protein